MMTRVFIGLGALLAPAVAHASEGGGDHGVIFNIALSMVAASAFGVLMRVTRQPLLLGYILAGVAIGPLGLSWIADHRDIVTIAEIGLILLLFMIGLEIDLRKMLADGKWVLIPGLLQFPVCVASAYGIFALLETWGIDVGAGSYARLYAGIAISLSSTMVVVKLLYDKMELDTLPGRVTVGILVLQDIWAIIVLAVQPNLNNPEVLGLAKTFGTGALLVVVAMNLTKYVLPVVFRACAQVPELMLVLSLGWCFLVATVAAHPLVGLSMEMGALIAGVSLATHPYNVDVVAKAVSIRDFFITLFFVALGMQIPMPRPEVILIALVIAGVALLTRWLGIFSVLYAMRGGHRLSMLTTINLSQVSEFSLVILSIGVNLGHIENDTLTYLIWVFSVLAVSAPYAINYSHELQSAFSRVLRAVGLKDIGGAQEAKGDAAKHRIVVLGFFRIATAFFQELLAAAPQLTRELKVIDINPKVKARLDEMGVTCVYGDISHADTLHHANIHDAEVILCTIPDSFLKGISNLKLLGMLRSAAPHARIIVTAETVTQAKDLYAAGADYVLQSSHVAGTSLARVVEQSLEGGIQKLREDAVRELELRQELIA